MDRKPSITNPVYRLPCWNFPNLPGEQNLLRYIKEGKTGNHNKTIKIKDYGFAQSYISLNQLLLLKWPRAK
jgi:hypothetical protein